MLARNAGTDFRPLPFLGNPHVQTILGFLWKSGRFRALTQTKFLRLDDGDEIALHDSIPPDWKADAPIALMMHGMGGDHRSSYLQRLAGALYPKGIRVVRMDLRGAGAGFGRAERFYHAGRTDDILAALKEIRTWSPTSPLWLIGFSLSGNMALKLAGEKGSEFMKLAARVAALAPPIDVLQCSKLISLPKNRIYDRFFANHLASLARQRQAFYPNPPLPVFPKRLTMKLFDDLFTAPRCGFADAYDYYRKTSSVSVIPNIKVPTLMLTARDDPFVAIAPFESLRTLPQVTLEIHDHGGHLGFLGYHGGSARWLERRVARWLLGET